MTAEIVLGIESSCDDTAIAAVDDNGKILKSIVLSQAKMHSEYGGVYPEFASRSHVASIIPAVDEVIRGIGIDPRDFKAIGVTRGPGLIGPLLVGLYTASGLGIAWKRPVIGINHLRGHLRSADLEEPRVKYPAIVLLVSGGHTILAHMQNPSRIKLLGSTRDDSAGEAYDKVGRMLGLGYPGGPVVDKMAKSGNPSIPFPRPMLKEGLEFSFSGLKSAVRRYLEKEQSPVVQDVAASFVQAVMDVLLAKCRMALRDSSAISLVVVGGVAASPQLRAMSRELCNEMKVELCLPPLRWATDNAAMIAMATWDYLREGKNPRPIPQLQLSIGEY